MGFWHNHCVQEFSTGYYATCKSNLQVQQEEHRQTLANLICETSVVRFYQTTAVLNNNRKREGYCRFTTVENRGQT